MDDLSGYELVTTHWMGRAACRGVDPDLFFVGRGESTDPAKAVCATCPVTVECAAYAAKLGQKKGVWGGLSERKRTGPGRPTTLRKIPPPHGTERRYHKGCRCDRCTEAQTAAVLERRRKGDRR